MASAVSIAKELADYNNKLERSNVDLQYGYNQALAQQDRDWQERMANSAHQRQVSDLKAAGLNPVLSVTGGSGAATGTGSSTQVSKPNVDMSLPGIVMDWATAQLNSATQLQRTAMETANAYSIAQLQADAAWERHIRPSGNSTVGSAEYVAEKSAGIVSKSFQWLKNQFGKIKEQNSDGRHLSKDTMSSLGLLSDSLSVGAMSSRLSALASSTKPRVKRSSKPSKDDVRLYGGSLPSKTSIYNNYKGYYRRFKKDKKK